MLRRQSDGLGGPVYLLRLYKPDVHYSLLIREAHANGRNNVQAHDNNQFVGVQADGSCCIECSRRVFRVMADIALPRAS